MGSRKDLFWVLFSSSSLSTIWMTILSAAVLKLADDTKLFNTVDNQQHACQSLQNDIDILGNWALNWHMKFNVDKCKVVHYGKSSIGFKYSLYGQLHSQQRRRIWEWCFPATSKLVPSTVKRVNHSVSYTELSSTGILQYSYLSTSPW